MTILTVLVPTPDGGGFNNAAAHLGTLSHAAASGGHLGFWAGIAIGVASLTAAFWAKVLGQHLLRRRQPKATRPELDFEEIRRWAADLEHTVEVSDDRRFAVPYLAHAAATVEAIRSRAGRSEDRGMQW